MIRKMMMNKILKIIVLTITREMLITTTIIIIGMENSIIMGDKETITTIIGRIIIIIKTIKSHTTTKISNITSMIKKKIVLKNKINKKAKLPIKIIARETIKVETTHLLVPISKAKEVV